MPSKKYKWVKKSLYACIMWLCLLHCESNFSLMCPFFIFSKFKIITLLSINIFPKPSMLKKYKYVLSSSSSTLKKYYTTYNKILHHQMEESGTKKYSLNLLLNFLTKKIHKKNTKIPHTTNTKIQYINQSIFLLWKRAWLKVTNHTTTIF